jgi:parallel beta-helix repeat protein
VGTRLPEPRRAANGRFMIATVLIAQVFLAASLPALDLYVSPDGNDSADGRAATASGSSAPFATIERARDEIRAARAAGQLGENVTVYLRGGTYFLDVPFLLETADSGTELHAITYRSFPGERAILSGGTPISGFEPVTVPSGVFAVAAKVPPDFEVEELYVDGRRATRTRVPEEGYYRIESVPDITGATPWNTGQDRFVYRAGDIDAWRNPEDIDVVVLHFWVESRMGVALIDPARRMVTTRAKSVFRLSDDWQSEPPRYYLEHVFESLDAPGEWYYDGSSGLLYYAPRPGEEWESAVFVVPVLERVVEVFGGSTEAERIRNVVFTDLTFSHTSYRLPEGSAGATQAAVGVPAAVTFGWATECRIARCEISNIGTYAVEAAYGATRVSITGNLMDDLGAGGVKVNRGAREITIADNEIRDGGLIFPSAVGVWIADSGSNTVVHNHIHHLLYTGISVGWTWGYGLSRATHNTIEHNHIHDIGQGVLSDMGGIYTLGISPGTTIRYNLVHDVYSYGYGGWGIYTDEGSTGILIENNIVYRTKTGGFHQHYGRENIVRNNIFAFAEIHQLQRTRAEEHSSFTFTGNIVLYDKGVLLGGNWRDGSFEMDRNLYWNAGRTRVFFDGLNLRSWQRLGHDRDSIIADPRFVDPANGDFRLEAGSPARTIGFVPIDVSNVGPRITPGHREIIARRVERTASRGAY